MNAHTPGVGTRVGSDLSVSALAAPALLRTSAVDPGAPALPGCLAAGLAAGSPPMTLLFPGVDARWPGVLAEGLVGRPELSDWLDAVLDALDAWCRAPRVRSLGAFPDGIARVARAAMRDAGGAAPAARVAATAPFALVGNLLANLIGVAGLHGEGLALQTPGTRAVGHSAGLLAAWVAGSDRDVRGVVPVGVAAQAAAIAALAGAHAARNPWSVPESALGGALVGDERASSPMVAVTGPRRARLESLVAGSGTSVVIAVANSARRHALVGSPAELAELRARMEQVAQDEADRRTRGRFGGAPLRFAWDPIATSAPFHHPALRGAAEDAADMAEHLGLTLPECSWPVIDPATTGPLVGSVRAIVTSVLAQPHDWAGAVASTVSDGGVAILASPLGGLAGATRSALRGRGALVIDPGTPEGREALFTPGQAPAIPAAFDSFAPKVVRQADGSARLENRHTLATGRSPFILPGMTPTTGEVPIVAAAANGGHVAELAGGAQVSERIFTERVAELGEALEPGQEVGFNALYLDPYLWNLHLGKERLVQKARAKGAPICGVTISAGIPDKAEALALLDDLAGQGIWLNAFKPGTVGGVDEVLAIAADCPHRIWMHLEGGAAGGHHSWEDLDELLLATYHRIRQHDNVILAVGGGIADPDRAAALLTGRWSLEHGAPRMPVDAVLLGTVTMAARESAASPAVKAALAAAAGHPGWVHRGEVAGGATSGRSGLDADIHFLDNSASRAAALLDSVAGDAAAVAARRDEIIEALSQTAKPYFGDLAEMTYAQVLRRFAALTALGRDRRYDDGAWLDPTHRARFVELLQRAEARLHPRDTGRVPTLFDDPASVDDPGAAIELLESAHPCAATALLHPADVDHFLAVARRPGKPVPFVPVIDADVRRWYQADALWQAHDERYDADQVLIIPGPVAVAGIDAVDEPVAALLDRYEAAVAAQIGAAGAPVVPFRLGGDLEAVADLRSPEVGQRAGVGRLVRAALQAATWQWAGASRPNPLHRLAPPARWVVEEGLATLAEGAESARVRAGAGVLEVVITWPDLGIPGDGRVVIPVEVGVRAGVVSFHVEAEGLDRAGRTVLAMLQGGTGGPQDPDHVAAAHAAAVGATKPLPDQVMSRVWPQAFRGLAEAGLAGGMFDLVHLRHEVSPGADIEPADGTLGIRVGRADGGLVVTTTSSRHGTVDRLFVRQARVPEDLPPVATVPAPAGVITTAPTRLGQLVIEAPETLDSFAVVSGDANPIHRSDLLARFVGLPGRIVHGMWTSAAASRAVVEVAAQGDPGRIRHWAIDFLAPVRPGQRVTFTVARTGRRAGERILSVEAATSDGVVAAGVATVVPPRTVYVFPGQGIQAQGMGMDGYARSRAAREAWERADEVTRTRLGFSVLQVVRDNPTSIEAVGRTFRHPSGVLHLTQFTQVAMATLAHAQVAEMAEAGVFDPSAAVAGHSVGEYNALAAVSGVLPLDSAIELVFARGLAMHGLVARDAEGRSDYLLAVVRPHLVGLSHAQAEALVAEVSDSTGELCQIVNHNLRGKQYAVAGTTGALAELGRRLGPGPAGREPLVFVPGIDVPFHSAALRGGVDEFRGHLQRKLPARIGVSALVGRYIPNLYPHLFRLDRDYVEGVASACGSPVLADLLAGWGGASADPDALGRTLLIELLAWQFASPVRWIESFELMCRAPGGLAAERIVEVGLGSAPTLANLAKGALALGSHRGTRPRVLHVELDHAEVFDDPVEQQPETDLAGDMADPHAGVAPEGGSPGPTSAGPTSADPAPAGPAPAGPTAAGPAPAGPASAPVADLPVDHATALVALLSLRAGVRPEQLEHDSVESLVEGASSRRNQVLMDLGKEFSVPAIDGAHEAPLGELTSTLAARAAGYRYPGPVLAAAVEAALTSALGPRGATPGTVARRVSDHWGLGPGWADRAAIALALGTRDASSRRGGTLATLSGSTVDELVDAAVLAAAAHAGVTIAAPIRPQAATLDAAAVSELREHVEGILVDQASGVLARLGRLPASAGDDADSRDAMAALALMESEHGAAALVAPAFDPRRHVVLDSGSHWARAEVSHLVQGALAAEAGHREMSEDQLRAWCEQIAVHRDAEPRIRLALTHHRDRLSGAYPRTVDLLDRALSMRPAGVSIAGLDELRSAFADRPASDAVTALAGLVDAPGEFASRVALVTGASPGSIAWSALAHLLRGGATVVVVTTTDTPERIRAYRDLERRYAGVGAQLHVIRANLASFADIEGLVEWLVTPSIQAVGAASREVKPALWPDLVLPFAAAPAAGELPDAGADAQLTLRLLLLGVQRLVGRLAERAGAAGRPPLGVVLPLSPNHGTFGGDGAYGEAKAALEAMVNRWHSEGTRWGRHVRLVAAEIGWVRGTGLMAGNDPLSAHVESALGVRTFSADQMGGLVAALCTPGFLARAGAAPVRVDLSGGLSGCGDLRGALAQATAAARGEGRAHPDPAATIAALPNLPRPLAEAGQPGVAASGGPGLVEPARLVPADPQGPAPAPGAGADRAGHRRPAARDMIVIAGIAEYGPWGSSATRWEAEVGHLSAAGIVELAWRCGLITWDPSKAGWLDAGTGAPVAEADVADRYREPVLARCGVRPLEQTEGVAADGVLELSEIFLDRALNCLQPTQAEAHALAAATPGALVTRAEGGWLVTLPPGSAVRVPRHRALKRAVGGQFPTGSDPVRSGLEPGVAAAMDPLAAWNVVTTAEALVDAGVSAEELVGSVHPGLVGNTQGTGMGGMNSIRTLHMAPTMGAEHANDVLQEALGNVVSAHVNQALVGGYGPMVHPVAACATAAVSLEEAVDKIVLGKAEIVIAGGWDDLGSEGIEGFADMSATADNEEMLAAGLAPHQHSRPGDRRRRGFVESQGGGSLVVCRGSVALALGLPVRAVVAYAGSFGDGIHTSVPAPGLGALGAARGGPRSPLARGLAGLGLAADDIALVSKHDTSTQANDPNEAFIHDRIQQALGRSPGNPLHVVSQKSLTGHAKGGAAAWQLAGICDIFERGIIPGNLNLTSVDPAVATGCLTPDHRPLVRHEPVRAALLTSLGFGHVSAVVALAHPDVFTAAIDPDERVGYLVAARARRADGARRRLAAQHGGNPVLQRRTDRRLGAGSARDLREREAGMLLDEQGTLPAWRRPR